LSEARRKCRGKVKENKARTLSQEMREAEKRDFLGADARGKISIPSGRYPDLEKTFGFEGSKLTKDMAETDEYVVALQNLPTASA
jgi:hypothetical protein